MLITPVWLLEDLQMVLPLLSCVASSMDFFSGSLFLEFFLLYHASNRCHLANAIFSHIMAFTPDFVRLPCFRDAPQIFVSHGTLDKEIRIEFSSHKIVPRLRSQGHSVLFLEFHGGHEVPHEIAQAAVKWFLESSSS